MGGWFQAVKKKFSGEKNQASKKQFENQPQEQEQQHQKKKKWSFTKNNPSTPKAQLSQRSESYDKSSESGSIKNIEKIPEVLASQDSLSVVDEHLQNPVPKDDVKPNTEEDANSHALSDDLEHEADEQNSSSYTLASVNKEDSDAGVVTAEADKNPIKLRDDPYAEEIAAVRIQAAFRGYLARRALRALKALVRLQALVRGHTVRRQATLTLRCMQSLIRIQSDARYRRRRNIGEVQSRRSVSEISPQVQMQLQLMRERKMRQDRAPANAYTHQVHKSEPNVTLPNLQQNGKWNWLEKRAVADSADDEDTDVESLKSPEGSKRHDINMSFKRWIRPEETKQAKLSPKQSPNLSKKAQERTMARNDHLLNSDESANMAKTPSASPLTPTKMKMDAKKLNNAKSPSSKVPMPTQQQSKKQQGSTSSNAALQQNIATTFNPQSETTTTSIKDTITNNPDSVYNGQINSSKQRKGAMPVSNVQIKTDQQRNTQRPVSDAQIKTDQNKNKSMSIPDIKTSQQKDTSLSLPEAQINSNKQKSTTLPVSDGQNNPKQQKNTLLSVSDAQINSNQQLSTTLPASDTQINSKLQKNTTLPVLDAQINSSQQISTTLIVSSGEIVSKQHKSTLVPITDNQINSNQKVNTTVPVSDVQTKPIQDDIKLAAAAISTTSNSVSVTTLNSPLTLVTATQIDSKTQQGSSLTTDDAPVSDAQNHTSKQGTGTRSTITTSSLPLSPDTQNNPAAKVMNSSNITSASGNSDKTNAAESTAAKTMNYSNLTSTSTATKTINSSNLASLSTSANSSTSTLTVKTSTKEHCNTSSTTTDITPNSLSIKTTLPDNQNNVKQQKNAVKGKQASLPGTPQQRHEQDRNHSPHSHTVDDGFDHDHKSSVFSFPRVPSYMASTKSAQAKSRPFTAGKQQPERLSVSSSSLVIPHRKLSSSLDAGPPLKPSTASNVSSRAQQSSGNQSVKRTSGPIKPNYSGPIKLNHSYNGGISLTASSNGKSSARRGF